MATLSRIDQEKIDKAIEQLQLDTGLSYPKDALLDITKALNIEVVIGKLPDFEGKQVKGIIKWKDGEEKPTIYLNESTPDTTRKFTLAHELGHFLLHKGMDKFRVDVVDYSLDTTESREESEANYFAGSFLVSKEKLQTLLTLTSDLDEVAKYFDVSRPVVENRIKWIQTN